MNHGLFLLSIYLGPTNSSLSIEHGLFQLIKKLSRSKQLLKLCLFLPVDRSCCNIRTERSLREVDCSVFCSKRHFKSRAFAFNSYYKCTSCINSLGHKISIVPLQANPWYGHGNLQHQTKTGNRGRGWSEYEASASSPFSVK